MRTPLFLPRFFPSLIVILLIGLTSGLPDARAQSASGGLPLFVVGPPNKNTGYGFRGLMEHPGDWQATRAVTNEILCAGATFSKYSDDELRKWFAQLRAWNIKLELEVGAIKPWGITGDQTFDKQRKSWDRIQSLGGVISSLAMDEPLSCTRREIKKPDDYAAEETARFIGLVQRNYPDIKIIDIEPYPSIPLADQKKWIRSLQQKLAEKNLKALAAFRLDVDWLNFSLRHVGSWEEVKQLEEDCRSLGCPFSLIYWASGYGYLEKRHQADDSTWYNGVMKQAIDYAAVGGKPDQYVIESWVGAPSVIVPESAALTFTRSALDLYNKVVKGSAANPPTAAASSVVDQSIDWQRKAVEMFPQLAVKDSPLNRLFVSEYSRLKAANPDFFANPQWPLDLAKQCDANLRK